MNDSGSDQAAAGYRRKPMWRRVVGWTVLLVVLLVVVRPLLELWFSGGIEIGPETTVVEGPLAVDGGIDYVAALNERLSEGVNPQNNAAVPLVWAFGPEVIDESVREAYFRQLGIEAPLTGDFVVDSQTFLKQSDEPHSHDHVEQSEAFEDQFSQAQTRPWSPDEFPVVAAWLNANAGPLERIVEASRRLRFYSPVVSAAEPPELFPALGLSLQSASRAAARLLVTRAMLRVGAGEVEAAWSDLLACHRLARLLGQGGTTIEHLIASAVHAMACTGDEGLRQSGDLSAEQAHRCLADLSGLPPLPRLIDAVDVGDRLAALDAVQTHARAKSAWDWNLILRMTNAHFDETVDALELDTHAARMRRLDAVERAMQANADVRRKPWKLAFSLVVNWRRTVSQHMGSVFALSYSTAPAQANVAETRAAARLQLTRLGFALAGWYAEHGAYPESLERLAPDWLAEVPLDPFVDEPFRYERTAHGFRLYSVGENMTDDRGAGFEARPARDDLLIEMPGAVEEHRDLSK